MGGWGGGQLKTERETWPRWPTDLCKNPPPLPRTPGRPFLGRDGGVLQPGPTLPRASPGRLGPRGHVARAVKRGLGSQTRPLSRGARAAAPHGPSSHRPARQRPLPTAREDGAHPRGAFPSLRAPRPSGASAPSPARGALPGTPPGRRASGPPRARGQDGSPAVPSPRAPPGTRCPATHLAAPSRPAAGPALGPRLSLPAGLLVAAAAAVTTGRSREQRFPPQRSAASDRPYTARELSPTPLPASVAPSPPPPPPSVAGSPASAQRRPRSGSRAARLGGAARGGCPDGGVPWESRPALACGRLGPWRARRAGERGWGGEGGGLGNPGLWKSRTRGLSFLIRKKGGREGWTAWRGLSALASVTFQVSGLKMSMGVCACLCGLGTRLL